VWAELSVQAVVDEHREKPRKWYDATCADDTYEDDTNVLSSNKDKLGFKQWLAVWKDGSPANAALETPERNCLVGTWKCHRESDISGDPRCREEYKWALSMPQVKAAFMDSQNRDDMSAAQADS
jgi:hypothetical protein